MTVYKTGYEIKKAFVAFISITSICLIISACSDSGTSENTAALNLSVYMSASFDEYSDRITVEWNPYSGADTYYVYRSFEEYGDYSLITAESEEDSLKITLWDDLTAMHYRTYYYRIRAANIVGFSDYSLPVEGRISTEKDNYDYFIVDPDTYSLLGRVWENSVSGGSATPGEFNSPGNIALCRDGSFFIADTGNGRIQHFDQDGNVKRIKASFTDFNEPEDLAVKQVGSADDEVFIYVCDTLYNRIFLIDAGGIVHQIWPPDVTQSGTDDGSFKTPAGIALAEDGTFIVSDTGNHRLKVYNEAGILTGWWGQLEGNTEFEWHTAGEGDCSGQSGNTGGQLNNPKGIAIDSCDNVYVADSGNYRVQKFKYNRSEKSLSYTGWWGLDNADPPVTGWHEPGQGSTGVQGDAEGQFMNPYSVATDRNGYVFVSDSVANRVQKFNHLGQFMTQMGNLYGQTTTALGNFNKCKGIALDFEGNLYVADQENHRVQKFIKIAGQ